MTPAPVGAQCAAHPGIAASWTCARCGNFMCATCAEGGAQDRCPRCRALQGGVDFPLSADSDFGAVWGLTVAAWQRELGMLSVVSLLFFALTIGGSFVASIISGVLNAFASLAPGEEGGLLATAVSFLVGQAIGTVVGMLVQAVVLVGTYRVLVDVLAGRKADVGRLFSQLHLVPRYVVLQLLFFVVITLPLLALAGVGAVAVLASVGASWSELQADDLGRMFGPVLVGVVLLFALVVVVGGLVLMPVTLFAVPEMMLSDCSAIEAVSRTWQLGHGQRLRIFGYALVSGGVVVLGAFACLLGVIPALPLAYMLLLSLYLALRRSSALPPVTP